MKTITMYRWCHSLKHGTFGKIVTPSFTLYTAEQPWRDNEPYKSCVPAGVYELVKFNSPKYGATFALKNHDLDVGVFEGEAKRFACVIHAANWPKQLQGCVAVGLDSIVLSGELAVSSSREATSKLLDYIRSAGITHLDIRNYIPEYP